MWLWGGRRWSVSTWCRFQGALQLFLCFLGFRCYKRNLTGTPLFFCTNVTNFMAGNKTGPLKGREGGGPALFFAEFIYLSKVFLFPFSILCSVIFNCQHCSCTYRRFFCKEETKLVVWFLLRTWAEIIKDLTYGKKRKGGRFNVWSLCLHILKDPYSAHFHIFNFRPRTPVELPHTIQTTL